MERIFEINKAITTFLTLGFIIAKRWGLDLSDMQQAITDLVVLAAGPYLVYLIPNRPGPDSDGATRSGGDDL